MRYYYADKDNKPVGPLTITELRKLAGSGVISGSTNIIAEGATAWNNWDQIQAVESRAEIADSVVMKATQIGEGLKRYDWGGFLFGLLLVMLEYLILPYALLKKAGADLSEWGRKRMLPTATSELPVLTFLTVVTRPAVHILWTAYYTIKALIFLANGKLETSFFGLFASYQQVEFPDRLYYFLGMCVAVYFMNFLIGLIFDALSLLVSMANSLTKLERK